MINLVNAIALRENMVRLWFDVPVYVTNVLDPGDATDPARYSFEADADSVGSDGLAPREVRPALIEASSDVTLDVWTDRRLSPFPSTYLVSVNGLLESPTLEVLNNYRASFFGLRAGVPVPSPDMAISNADFANPQTLSGALDPLPNPGDSVLGTLPVDETGDLAKDEGLQSYKKRVFRRLTTKKGRFRHLPDYGTIVLDSVKMLARPGLLGQISADAEEQIKQEPETVAVQVRIVRQGELAFYRIRVRCSFGATIDMSVPIAITG